MELRNKIWLYPYNTESDSAKLLAQKMDVGFVQDERQRWHGQRGQFILNWGAGTGCYAGDTGDATLLNPPELIDLSINKIRWFDRMTDEGGPRTPEWTQSQRTAKHWLEQGHQVLARKQVEGCKGAGIVMMKKPLDFVYAPLYTIRVEDVVAEWRVYMFKDEVLDYRLKKDDTAVDGIMVGDGPRFLIDERPLPDDVIRQSRKAAKRLALTTQGLDVLWDGKKAYVLETNTAPYLGIQVANNYARRFQRFLKEAA